MNDKPQLKVSRRDAVKILAAAVGATALSNLPGKWTKPSLDVGILPAHALTSGSKYNYIITPEWNGAHELIRGGKCDVYCGYFCGTCRHRRSRMGICKCRRWYWQWHSTVYQPRLLAF